MKNDILLGDFYNDLKIEQLNPLCLKAWIDDGNHIIEVFVKNDANEFLNDLRNGEHKFSFWGTYNSPQQFVSSGASPAHPISLYDYIEKLDKKDTNGMRSTILHAMQASY